MHQLRNTSCWNWDRTAASTIQKSCHVIFCGYFVCYKKMTNTYIYIYIKKKTTEIRAVVPFLENRQTMVHFTFQAQNLQQCLNLVERPTHKHHLQGNKACVPTRHFLSIFDLLQENDKSTSELWSTSTNGRGLFGSGSASDWCLEFWTELSLLWWHRENHVVLGKWDIPSFMLHSDTLIVMRTFIMDG